MNKINIMKEFNGTKGEWVIKDKPFFDALSNVWKVAIYSDNLRFCQYIAGRTEEEALANAQLIAAAPDLLEALLSLMDGITNLPPLVAIDGVLQTEWEQGLKAINKALGL